VQSERHLRVVRGVPSAEELAVVTAVLLARASAELSGAMSPEPAAAEPGWMRSGRREPAGAWRILQR
jgi:hypothetical protein